MPIDRKRFTVAFLAANVLLVCFVAGLLSAGVTLAVPTGDVGGFTVAFDELQGEGFEQDSTMSSRDGCGTYPVSETRITNGTIDGLHLFKDLEMPITDDTVRVSIKAERVAFRGLDQQFTELKGNISFEGDQVVEYDTAADRMRVTSRNITIEDGSIQTETQYITRLSLDELNVGVVTNPENSEGDGSVINCRTETGIENTSTADESAANDSSVSN
ncbi:hypothetical protein [Natrinema caseinilyticum]|uniref:hypothetical protein n=1 Tax=Natrinema caseinilyticum TaxID=2961570 RepID=UPI0020C36472|nr:hypothetical protein [Natrinema caseinilyticum]